MVQKGYISPPCCGKAFCPQVKSEKASISNWNAFWADACCAGNRKGAATKAVAVGVAFSGADGRATCLKCHNVAMPACLEQRNFPPKIHAAIIPVVQDFDGNRLRCGAHRLVHLTTEVFSFRTDILTASNPCQQVFVLRPSARCPLRICIVCVNPLQRPQLEDG